MNHSRLSITKNFLTALNGRWALVLCAAVGLGAYAGMVSVHRQYGSLRDGHIPQTLAWYGLAFGAYLAAILWTERRQAASIALVWGAAIAFRALLLLTTPTLSDDVYRYLWDGHVANHGVSPYAYPIDSPALDDLDIPQRALANNPEMASPYLPTAQFLFVALTCLFPLQPLFFQIAMVGFDLLNGLLIARLLKTAGLSARRILIYLWNPLVIVEVAHGAHVDAWMIFLTLLAVWLSLTPLRSSTCQEGGPKSLSFLYWAAPVILALATLTKILPLLLLPILFWRWRWGQLALYGLVTIALLVPSGLRAGWGLTGPLDGTGLFGAIRIYADRWNFNSGLFHWLQVDLLQPHLAPVEADEWAKRGVTLILLASLLAVWLQARRRLDPRSTLRLMAIPFMAYLLLTTTVHPWYLLVLLAFAPFLPPAPGEARRCWLAIAAWLYLSATAPLSYLTYLNPLDFRELEWVRRTEWLPAVGLVMVWFIWSKWAKRNSVKRHR